MNEGNDNMTAKALWLTTSGEVVELNDISSQALSEAVGGWLEAVQPHERLTLWMNEEGKLNGLPHNLKGQAIWEAFFEADSDYIVGNIVLTGGVDEEGETLPLSSEDLTVLKKALN